MASRKKRANRDVDREHEPEVFVRLRNTSVRCIESSLACVPKGQEDYPKSSMQIIRLGRQIEQQLMDMKTDIHTRQLSKENVTESLNVSLSVARVPLENKMCSVRNKELALMRMQTFNALLNVLQRDATQRQPIMEVMNHSMDISKQIIALQQSNRQLEEQLIDIARKRIETRIKQQKLFQKLKSAEEMNRKIRDLETKTQVKGRETMQSVRNEVVVIQEVFQRLIMSAQLNWAEDPYLKTLVLKMRDPPLS
ncbi:centromere protein H-like isoform X1 [Rhinoderma darwinii]|uniref:centromere protein H-like isoform X1 n=1 Tax=Rhinoderma darwinii TaxID=43563 RepID=UPI003F66F576